MGEHQREAPRVGVDVEVDAALAHLLEAGVRAGRRVAVEGHRGLLLHQGVGADGGARGLRDQEGGAVAVLRAQVALLGAALPAIAAQVEEKLKDIEEPIEVAVMGCVVNGPGEARGADVGIAGGNGEGLIFRKGEIVRKVPEADLVNELFQEIDQILEERKHASK